MLKHFFQSALMIDKFKFFRFFTVNKVVKLKSNIMKKQTGFTLIELLVTIAIVGILSAVAMPMYDSYMKKSRRSDAVSALMNMQLAQEKYRATHSTYASSIADLGLGATSSQGYYDLALSQGSTNDWATSYQITADPVTNGAQDGDTCTSSHMIVNQNGPVLTDATKKECWSR